MLAFLVLSSTQPAVGQTLVNFGAFDRPDSTALRSRLPQRAMELSNRIGVNQRSETGLLNDAAVAEQKAAWSNAVDQAKDDPDHFAALLRAHLASDGEELPETPLGKAAGIAEIAADSFAYASFISRVPPADRAYFDRLADELRAKVGDVTAKAGGTQVYVTADGNLRGEADSGPEGSPVGTGSLAVFAATPWAFWKAGLAIASTQDTVHDGFGTSLLAPASGRALTSGLIDMHLRRYLPLHMYASVARSLWQVHDTPNVQTSDVTVLGVGALLYRDLASGAVQGSNIGLSAEAGIAARFLGGDIMSVSDSARAELLSTKNSNFWGVETGLQITVGKLAGALQLYYTFHGKDERIPGLSGLQLVAGIGVTGELFGGSVGKR